MGVIAQLVAADLSEARAVLDSDDPVRSWDGFIDKGLDALRLTALWSLAETGLPDDRLVERLEALGEIHDPEEGRWVLIIPPRMLAALASLAEEPEELEHLAGFLGSTDEFDGLDEPEVLDLLRLVGDLAETAELGRKTLLLWLEG